MLEEYKEGVWLIELAALSDPALVPQTVAEVLSIREAPGEPILKTLISALKERQMLLVLDNRFRLLTEGNRTALPRQQTLRAMIDWSYDLLKGQERLLLCRLSMFAGGWTLESAEKVCSSPPSPSPAERSKGIQDLSP